VTTLMLKTRHGLLLAFSFHHILQSICIKPLSTIYRIKIGHIYFLNPRLCSFD